MEGDEDERSTNPNNLISTHALRMEGDAASFIECIKRHGISTHALRMEGDRCNP